MQDENLEKPENNQASEEVQSFLKEESALITPLSNPLLFT